ncbi:Calmodulin [Toxocara canis]|uniref:Calmodulin n=1 Tax=Toxocara canis TaxID=6265 RepID=A0A0B2VDU3_TOXCA|nr:Calmodulin [Toxocara canis]
MWLEQSGQRICFEGQGKEYGWNSQNMEYDRNSQEKKCGWNSQGKEYGQSAQGKEYELSETFDLLDVDHDGRLSRNEIAALLRAINVEPTRIELDFIFKEMDTDKSGKINKEEFVRYMSAPPKHRTTIGELEKQFRQFDRDGDGSITQAALPPVCTSAHSSPASPGDDQPECALSHYSIMRSATFFVDSFAD